MRKFLLIIPLVLSSILANAQENMGGFKLIDNTLIWQEVYSFPETDSASVQRFFYSNSKFKTDNNVSTAYIVLRDYVDIPFGQRPVFFNDVSRIKFVVQIKNDRYRVTVQSLEPIDTFIRNNTSRSYEDAKYLSNFLEHYVKKNGELKASFYNNAPSTDEALLVLFDYKTNNSTIVLDDDF